MFSYYFIGFLPVIHFMFMLLGNNASWHVNSLNKNFLCIYFYSSSNELELIFKVENILKGSLDLIPSPSPSVKIQIMGGKVCLRYKGKTLLGDVNKLFVFKSLLTTPSNVLPYLPYLTFCYFSSIIKPFKKPYSD